MDVEKYTLLGNVLPWQIQIYQKKKSKYFILLVSLSNWKMYSNFQGGSLKCRSMSVWDMLRVEGSLQGAISAEIGTNTQGENFP